MIAAEISVRVSRIDNTAATPMPHLVVAFCPIEEKNGRSSKIMVKSYTYRRKKKVHQENGIPRIENFIAKSDD